MSHNYSGILNGLSKVWSNQHGQMGNCEIPRYFALPQLFQWPISLLVPCWFDRTFERLVGIAKIPCTRSRKYRLPGTCIPKKPSTKQSVHVYTVFTLWNTGILKRSMCSYAEPWLLWWWCHRPSQNTAIIPNTAAIPNTVVISNIEYRGILVMVYRLSKKLIHTCTVHYYYAHVCRPVCSVDACTNHRQSMRNDGSQSQWVRLWW